MYTLTSIAVIIVFVANVFQEKLSIACCKTVGCFSVSPGSYVTVYAPLKPGIIDCSPTCNHIWTINSGTANVFHIKGWVHNDETYTAPTQPTPPTSVSGTKYNYYWGNPRSHTCMQSKNLSSGQYYNYCGGGTYNQIITKATLLLNEFIFGEDTDGNDLIYGIDFMIVGDGKPAILEQIEHMEQWMDPECKITWQQYQDWIDNLDDPEYDPFQNGTCGGNGGEE